MNIRVTLILTTFLMFVCTSHAIDLDKDYFNWTIFTTSPTQDIIYVSQDGDDNNSGLSPTQPVRHISRALQLIDDGDGDWVLLKRGDSFDFPEIVGEGDQSVTFDTLWISYSGDLQNNNYMLIGAYGDLDDPRPIINSEVIIGGGGIALCSLHIHGDGNNTGEGLKLSGSVVGSKQNGSGNNGSIYPTPGGIYAKQDLASYYIEIDGDGTPNTFKWKLSDGEWTTNVPCIVDDANNDGNYLSNGVGIIWNNSTGGVIADHWYIPMLTTGASPFFGEDLLIEGWGTGIEIEDPDFITIRRCVIMDNSIHGMFIGGVGHRSGPKDGAPDNLTIEENIFDNNGLNGNTQHNIYKVRGGEYQYYEQNYFLDDHLGTNNGIKIRAPGSQIHVYDNIFSGVTTAIGAKGDTQDYEERFHITWNITDLFIRGNVLVDLGADSTMIGMSFANTMNFEVMDNIFGHSTYAHRNQAIIFHNQSADNQNPNTNALTQIENFQISNNRFIGFQSVAIEMASYIDGQNNDIFDNFIHLADNGEILTAIMEVGETHETVVNWRNNKYFSPYNENKWFEYAGNKISCEEFVSLVNETGYEKFTEPQLFNNGDADLGEFNVTLGGIDSLGEFRAALRQQRKGNWDPRLDSQWAKWYFQISYNVITGDSLIPKVHKINTLDLVGDVGIPITIITVVYTDNDALNSQTIGDGDIRVLGPGFDEQPVFFSKAQTVGTSNSITATYFLAGPAGLWDKQDNGTYIVMMNEDQVSDNSGNYIAGGELGTFTCAIGASQAQSNVTGRYVFYNNSHFDNNSAAANINDDDAIATDKQALLPGETATFANYTSYVKGINGIIIDIFDLVDLPTADDFIFQIGNDNSPGQWLAAPEPTSITVRGGAGIGESDRITIIFPDNAISKTWLRVTIKSSDATGLALPDVFYFGNAIGDIGDNSANTFVNATDEIAVRNNPRQFLRPAAIDNPYDFNRDCRVNATDQIVPRNNLTNFSTALFLITPPY